MKKILSDHVTTNKRKYMWLICAFIAGAVIGGAACGLLSEEARSGLVRDLNEFFLNSSQGQASFDRTAYFRRNLTGELKLHLALWVCGLTVLGVAAAPAFAAFKGFSLGFTMTFIVSQYGLRGFAYDLATIVPQNLIKVPALFFTCMCMMSYSMKQTSRGGGGRGQSSGQLFSLYSFMLFASFLVSAAGVLFESYVTPSLIFMITGDMI